MEYKERVDLRDKKEEEIKMVLDLNIKSSNKVFDDLKRIKAISISSPLEPPVIIEFMSTNSYGETESRKLGNIRLNMGKLMYAIPAIIVTGVGYTSNNWILQVSALLIIWKELRDCSTIDISEEEAKVMIALWKNCDRRHTISKSDGYNAVKEYLVNTGQKTIDDIDFQNILRKLSVIGSIEITGDRIWLREWIQSTYW